MVLFGCNVVVLNIAYGCVYTGVCGDVCDYLLGRARVALKRVANMQQKCGTRGQARERFPKMSQRGKSQNKSIAWPAMLIGRGRGKSQVWNGSM